MAVNSDFWAFVDKNMATSPAVLRLKWHGKGHELEITQIECRQKFRKKLAETLSAVPRLLFPSVLAGEQATSDLLAAYHASLVDGGPQTSIVDLTAGLGIDAMRLAAKCGKLVAIDCEKDKAEALAYNFGQAGLEHCQAVHADCREFAEAYGGPRFDYAFIDPARRAADGSRLYALADCSPDVAAMLPSIERIAKRLIVKASPMLDISRMASELPGADRIIALGTATECKELIAIIDFDSPRQGGYQVEAVTLLPGRPACTVAFTAEQAADAVCKMSTALPAMGSYLYEPYPAVMKAAPYYLLSAKHGLAKLSPNTHLYNGPELVDGFPGDALEVIESIPYESKHIKRLRKTYPSIRVTTRNFDVSADALRKKLGVRDGGDLRLFAVTAAPRLKAMIIAKPVG